MTPARAAELRAEIHDRRRWGVDAAPAIAADELLALIDRAFPPSADELLVRIQQKEGLR